MFYSLFPLLTWLLPLQPPLYFLNTQVPSHLNVSAFAGSSAWNVTSLDLHMVISLPREACPDPQCKAAPAPVTPSVIYQYSFSSQPLLFPGQISLLTVSLLFVPQPAQPNAGTLLWSLPCPL